MDKKTLEFVTFCISKLSILLKLPQKEVYGRLKKSGILYEYIMNRLEAVFEVTEEPAAMDNDAVAKEILQWIFSEKEPLIN